MDAVTADVSQDSATATKPGPGPQAISLGKNEAAGRVTAEVGWRSVSRSSYADTFAGMSSDEIRTMAEVKRFLECYEGDRSFREALDAGGQFTDEQRRMLKDVGVTFAPEAMELLWTRRDLADRIPPLVAQCESFDEAPSEIRDAVAPYPELRIWYTWRHRCERLRMIQKLLVTAQPTRSPEYTAWRARRVAAVRNELAEFGWALDHPCHAVEMAVGCSVRCGFCAFDAGKLETVFDLARPENRELVARGAWHAVLEHGATRQPALREAPATMGGNDRRDAVHRDRPGRRGLGRRPDRLLLHGTLAVATDQRAVAQHHAASAQGLHADADA